MAGANNMHEDRFAQNRTPLSMRIVRTILIIALICALALLAAKCAPEAFASERPHQEAGAQG